MAERRLGRGLSSLVSSSTARQAVRSMVDAPAGARVEEIPVESIHANRQQPRRTFDLETITELAASLSSVGQIAPIVLRRDGPDRYEIIAGERRWRAASQLGWPTVKAIVREASDQERLEIALVENVQREDLNPIDRATACRTLVEEFSLTHEQIGQRIGMSRPALSNLLRLLELPEDLRDMVKDGQLSAGHARALLGVEDDDQRRELADLVQLEGLSVRALERAVQEERKRPAPTRKPRRKRREVSAQVVAMEHKIARLLGTKVRIQPRGEGGRICIDYFSNQDFERILDKMGG